jgi:uncharacterized protein YbaR (Trm112 family)
MGNVFDIIICPECHGEKTFVSGQVMKDAKIYLIKEACPKCKGHGKIGLERKENINDESQMFFDLSDLVVFD